MKDLSRRQLISKTLVASAAATSRRFHIGFRIIGAITTGPTDQRDIPTFDVVIVGGGSAGAVMAARLSETLRAGSCC